MKKAIEKSIYYTNVSPNYLTEIKVSNSSEFKNVMKNLNSYIDIITYFAPKEDISYQICSKISEMYNSLLLDKIGYLYIINKKDLAIRISFVSDEIEKKEIGIIRIDSVLSEYYKEKTPFFGYSFSFILGLMGGVSIFSFIPKIKID